MPDKIINELTTFADKLLTCIAADNEEGQQKLINIFSQAKKNTVMKILQFGGGFIVLVVNAQKNLVTR